ncbi:MAG: efflux RND transporter periplasmic adaptor subunit [Acidobacteriota bacterium]|jgi:membrane fusion protein (multidrug efflux system)
MRPICTASSCSSIPLALAPLVLLAALWAAGCGGDGEPAAATPPESPEPESRGVPVRTVTVRPEDVVEMLDLPADLRPDRRAVLAAEVPGTVESLLVEEGDRVAEGELLATVDIRALEQALAEARAVHERAADEHRRAETLYEKRSITRSDLVAARTEKDVAVARLDSAKLQLDKSRLEAPWAGVVTATRVEVGDYAVPGQAMVELVDSDPLKVRAPVPATDVPYVQVGEPVTVRISSLPGEEITGRVVRLAAELDPGARTLGLEVEIPNPHGRLKPGMLARVRIPRQRLEGALLVPLEAPIDLEDRKVVYVVVDGAAERRTVELGPTIGERIVVERGLEPGDRVIVQGQSRVAPGERVEERTEDAGAGEAS